MSHTIVNVGFHLEGAVLISIVTAICSGEFVSGQTTDKNGFQVFVEETLSFQGCG